MLFIRREYQSMVGVQGGQSATPDSEKVAKNREKEKKYREENAKSGRFFHFAPIDRYQCCLSVEHGNFLVLLP